ncbi:type I-E CRISPR-associated protein Cas6/Cse3/CasE [Streptomyces cyaneofuscatus]|uniref:type I-E CRISPR-associated protein Cas6/Cse3/CasE n=3 Tax=Streptomyces cyaneofuscatus TaxID=66883 RepID=UPI0036EE94E0
MHDLTLTRLHLNLTHPTARRDLNDTIALHRTLMRLVPDNLGNHPRHTTNLLFRLEPDHPGQPPVLLVQSTTRPDPDRLPAHYATATLHPLTGLLAHLTPHRRVRYRITASPSRRNHGVPQPHRPTPRPRSLTPLTGADALAWWHRRATQAGLNCTSHPHMTPAPFHPTRPGPSPQHHLTRFDGTATITDPEALTHALITGIGRGKSYGAGLLSLLPA